MVGSDFDGLIHGTDELPPLPASNIRARGVFKIPFTRGLHKVITPPQNQYIFKFKKPV
jgi:hypothetical protein